MTRAGESTASDVVIKMEDAATAACKRSDSDAPLGTPRASALSSLLDGGAHVSDEIVMETLWGRDAAAASTSLDYVRGHARRMVARVLREDPHTAYIPLRAKPLDVRLFKVATLVAETPLEHERCDFRGVTRVPGSIDTVLGLLASEDERESYWVALNTQRGLLVNSLFATRRLEGNSAPFPRWNQRYTATKFSKQSPPVECCFGEYAAFHPLEGMEDEVDDADDGAASGRARLASQDSMAAADGAPLRRAFVYRRSMDHRLFNMEDVQEKLHKYGETCERLYLQDFLLEVAETSEKHICKVVLTCSVYITNNTTAAAAAAQDERQSKSMRHEFRESCTNMLLSLRQVLSNQWVEHMANAGMVGPSSASLLSRSLGRRAPGQPAHCGVCSAGFSLLKKRNVCHACSLVVCSRCCTKQERGSIVGSSGNGNGGGGLLSQRSGTAHDLNSRRATRECILCSQFGSEGGGEARLSVSIRRHFTNSTLNSARSMTATSSELDDERETLSHSGHDDEDVDDEDVKVITTLEDLDDEQQQQPAGDNQSQTRDGETGDGDPKKPRGNLRLRAATEDNTIAITWRESESDLPPRQTPMRRRFKQRCESATLTSARGPGVVLLTDIDTLSLTGSFHRLSTASTGTAGSSSSRRGSNGSETGLTTSNFVRASPPLPPIAGGRRAIRSVSEDTTLLPKGFQAGAGTPNNSQSGDDELLDIDDLANFNLKLL